MNKLIRYLTLAAVAGSLTFSTAAWAGECCTKTAEKTKKGECCAKCVEAECCKEAAKTASKQEGAAKTCATCAKKADKPS